MFKNLKIGAKLIGGFLGVSSLCAVVGVIALVSMSRVRTYTGDIAANQVPSLRGVAAMSGALSDMRQYEQTMIVDRVLSDSVDYLRARAGFGTASKDEFEKGRALYEPLPRTPEADAVWKDFLGRVTAYRAHMDEVLPALDRNDVRPAVSGAVRGRELLAAAQDLATKLLDIQDKSTNTNIAAANSAEITAKVVVVAIMLFAVLVAIIAGLVIARAITRPLAAVVERTDRLRSIGIANLGKGAEALAQGDFHYVVTADNEALHNDARDETGDLARAINGIIEQTHASAAAFERARTTLQSAIGDAQALARAAHDGKLDERADASKYAGGYRELVGGMNDTLAAVNESLGAITPALQRAADRDLSARVDGQFRGAYARVQEITNLTIRNLDEALGEVTVASEQVASASDQISAGSQTLAEGASEQASALEEVSSSLQELASMAKQSAANAQEARGLSEAARGDTSKGVGNVQRLNAAMEKIKSSSDSTAKIVKTIDEIAFQTNLLALNAAVEAARAGDAGKGFAVVAEEVRNLAMRSSEAAKNTAALIEESVHNAGNGVTLSSEVAKSLAEITTRVTKVAEVMAEIAAASEQQTQGIAQINGAVEQMNDTTQQVAANSEESASAAEELSGQAERLQETVGRFNLSDTSTRGRAAGRGAKRPQPSTPAAARTSAKAPPTRASMKSRATPRATAPARHLDRLDPESVIPLHDDGDDDVLGEF